MSSGGDQQGASAGVSATRRAVPHRLSLCGVNYTTPYDVVVGYCTAVSDASKERPRDTNFTLRAIQDYLRSFDGGEPKVLTAQQLIDDTSIPMPPQFEDWNPKNTGVELPERVDGQNVIRFTFRDTHNHILTDELVPQVAYNILCYNIYDPGVAEGESAVYLRVGSVPRNN
ncbi:uncharacterized protein BCR38DRAFT_482187 [Pseudomassariella vexata]|uniref:Uncharacterized protein n=1 Tax=Pseudomassariella vexata TaxID=1141098 RepID=A0A1Y2EBQ3_9PEZI|nr:uncharacterized protein BCR38DRAFT_482187 [Pseudomassariella vexata]ORY68696.1 hypothetical protein BCR38DRAFT_482187 [Pseudomassariella vexata]